MEEMKCGIEIHQRLAGRKLFCHCVPPNDEEAKELMKKARVIKRRLHVVYSEMEEVDEAAERETKKDRVYEYLYHPNFACLVDLDEEPPHEISEEALKTTIMICKALHTRFVDELIVMRKMVLDGSNTSGFQRTTIVGLDGYVEVEGKRIGIRTVCLEEESAGIVEQKEDKAVYSLHRLGIPLVEIATAPDITSPQELRKVAEKIGKILRLVGGIRRGIGTIRQDVNISIEGGARVEIKGVQELKLLEDVARYEIRRQKALIEINEEIKRRYNTNEKIIRIEQNMVDITDLIPETSKIYKWIKNGVALAVKLPRFAGLLGRELCPNRRYGTELSDYAKTMGVGGLVHSDENPAKHGCNEELWKAIKQRLKCGEEDAFVFVVSNRERGERALREVMKRAGMLFVPEETRKANADGTSSYMRPLPGGARMYPETDIPSIDLGEWVNEIEFVDPEEREKRIKEILPQELADRILTSKYLSFFEELCQEGCDPKVTASTLLNSLPMLRREGLDVDSEASRSKIKQVLLAFRDRKIAKKGIERAIRDLIEGLEYETVINKYRLISGDALRELVKEKNYNMKEIMASVGYRVEAEEVIRIIKELREK